MPQQIIKRIKPDALFHHDDWGSQIASLISPQMFEEFFLEPYKKAYGFWKDNGVELIVHHSDSYAANLVPYMIDMGIDIWQGVMTTNNTPRAHQTIRRADFLHGRTRLRRPPGRQGLGCQDDRRTCGKGVPDLRKSTISSPCLTQGLNFSSFPGVYEATSEAIERMSKKMF